MSQKLHITISNFRMVENDNTYEAKSLWSKPIGELLSPEIVSKKSISKILQDCKGQVVDVRLSIGGNIPEQIYMINKPPQKITITPDI